VPDVSHFLFGLMAIGALVFANGFFVAAEFALVTVRKTRVDQLIAEGNRTARVVRRALGDTDSYIAATQLGITMTSLGLGWIGEPALAATFEPAFAFLGPTVAATTAHSFAVAVAFGIITALHIVFGELAPKTVALQRPERVSLIVVRPLEVFKRIFWPFIALLNGMGRAVVHSVGLRAPSGHSLVHSEEELKMLVTASQEAGVIEEDEEQMLHRVFGFADLTAGQVMVPRTEMVALAVTATPEQLVQALGQGVIDRFPV
jgi:putative hemolysin